MSVASRCLAFLSVVALTIPPVLADVIVVDASGGGETTNLTTAALFAKDGDMLLVRAGNYVTGGSGGTVSIVGKSLSIIADGGVVTTGPITVSGLGEDDVVLLRGLHASVPFNAEGPGLQVTNSDGQVRVEDCSLTGNDGFFTLFAVSGEPGALVSNSTHVSFSNSTLVGGRGVDSFFPYAALPSEGGAGLDVTNAGVSLHNCNVNGGEGGDFVGFSGDPGPGANGSAGIGGSDADVYLSGNYIVGGPAGFGDELVPTPGFYTGGDAIELTGTSTLRELIGNDLTVGGGGVNGAGIFGPAGIERDIPAGALTVFVGTPRTFSVESPTREGSSVTMNYDGKPFDTIAVFVSLSPGAFLLPSAKGLWLQGDPLITSVFLGGVDENGDYSLTAALPDFGLGPDDAIILYEQVFVVGSSDGKVLSAPSTHVIIDDSL